jgi:hypothetical protein
MSFHVFHGSEDGTYVPTDDGLSATIAAGPRAPSTSPLSVRNNPLLVQPVLLEEMDAEGLCIYLTNLVKDAELVGDIRERLGDLGGRRWTELLSAMPDGQSFCMLREDLKIANRFVVAELLVDVAHAHARMTTSVRAGAAYAIAPGRDAHGQHLGAGALGEGARHTNSELSSSLSVFGALDRVRLEDMPTLAKLEESGKMVSSLVLERFRISMCAWLSANSSVMAKAVDTIISVPATSLEGFYTLLGPAELKFDCRTGSKLFSSADSSIQDMLLSDDSRRHNGAESLLRIVQSIASIVNFQCEERTALMLQNYQVEHPPVLEPADLEAAINKFVADYGVWARISTVDCAALYKVGIQNLMKSLFCRADMIAPLVAPIGMVQAQHPNDGVQYLKAVKQCARVLTLWPRQEEMKTMPVVPQVSVPLNGPVPKVGIAEPLLMQHSAGLNHVCAVTSALSTGDNSLKTLTGGTGEHGGKTRGSEQTAQYDIQQQIKVKTAEYLKAAGFTRG